MRTEINLALKIANLAMKFGLEFYDMLLKKYEEGQVVITKEEIDQFETKKTTWKDFVGRRLRNHE